MSLFLTQKRSEMGLHHHQSHPHIRMRWSSVLSNALEIEHCLKGLVTMLDASSSHDSLIQVHTVVMSGFLRDPEAVNVCPVESISQSVHFILLLLEWFVDAHI